MFFLIGFLTALAVLGAGAWFLPFEVVIKYKYNQEEKSGHQLFISGSVLQGRMRVELGPYFLGRRNAEEGVVLPAGKEGGHQSKLMLILNNAVSRMEKGYAWLVRAENFFSRFRLREWQWRSKIGLGDPAQTAVAAGVLWGLKGWVWARLSKRYRTGKQLYTRLEVYPDYLQRTLMIDLRLVLEGRLGPVLLGLRKRRKRFAKARDAADVSRRDTVAEGDSRQGFGGE